ncbi:MAG: dienelactone hydrolase family protein [Vulcanimicrobiaceae bacterium]
MSEHVDPNAAVGPDVARGTFLGLTTVATASAASTAAVMAQGFGQTHAPSVAENDPAISTAQITLELAGGAIDAYAAWPKGAAATVPALVVTMHIWGVDTSIRDTVRRLAKAGIAAVAPNLYARFGAPSGDDISDSSVFRPYAKRLDPKQNAADLLAGRTWLGGKFTKSKIGVMGFCMGGHIALLQAIDNAAAFAATCAFYGAVEGVDPSKIHMPVWGSYGGRDTSIPPDGVRAFAVALSVPNDIKIYPEAGHAFFDDQRSAYVATAASDAWARLLAFVAAHLGQPQP